MANPKSKKWAVDAKDFINGFIRSVFSSVSATVLQSVSAGGEFTMPTIAVLKVSALVGAATFIGSVTKSWITNSQGSVTAKEPAGNIDAPYKAP